MKRKTTCKVQGHGTRCEASEEKNNVYARCTENNLAMKYETKANNGRQHTSQQTDIDNIGPIWEVFLWLIQSLMKLQ